MARRVKGGRCEQTIAYNPLPSQAEFHALEARFKGFSGPIGSGKSQALCQEAIRLSYLNAGRAGLLGAPTYPMLRDSTQSSLIEVIESNGIPYEWNKAENQMVLKDVRSKILFRSLEDYERLRGTNLAWFGVDELSYAREEAWLRLEGRLRDPRASRLCGFAVWTPKGYDWVYRRFIASRVEGYAVVVAKPFENRHLLEQVPDYYERLRRSYDARFYEQEVLGGYLNVGAGRAYYAFDREVNVGVVEYDASLPLLWALDFNVNPMSSVVVQIDGSVVRVLDEIQIPDAYTLDACGEFQRRYPAPKAGLIIYGDASGAHRQTAGTSDYQVIQSFFRSWKIERVQYRVPRSNPLVRERVSQVNAKLRTAAGDVELMIDPRCKELVKDLEEVVYKEGTMVLDKDKDPRRTHLSDALGYLIWEECRPQPVIGERSERLL